MSKRKYSGTDVEMLTTVSTVLQAAIQHKPFLISKRASWADPFFSDFETRIDAAVVTYLGFDNARALRTQTAALQALVKPVYDNLAFVKIQIEEDFKGDTSRLNEILNTLGYKTIWKSDGGADQEALIQMLYRFSTNLTSDIRTQLVAKGIADSTLTEITDAAEELRNANVSQESIKQSRKGQTATAVTELNAIYDMGVSIGRISRKIFKDNPAVADQFSLAKILRNLRSGNLTTRFEGEIQVNSDSPYVFKDFRITARSVVTLYTTSNLVYVCRNPEGCYGSAFEAYLLTPEVESILRKADLTGEGKNLVITTLTPGFATVRVKIQG